MDKESSVKLKRKIILNLFIVLSVIFALQACSFSNEAKVRMAIKKVNDLFVDSDKEDIQEGKSGNIKASTNQKQIEKAMEAIEKIDTSGENQTENQAIVFGLQLGVLNAQLQLAKREGTQQDSSNNNKGDEEQIKAFYPDEKDVVLKDGNLKNKDTLEKFMKVAGENGEDNESEIRIVKNEGIKGVLIYDLRSRYDKNADQRWIEVYPDLSYYSAAENESQDVFNHAPQQCGFMSKDETEGYYILNECRTNLEYRFLPISN
ncbi:hypothetical protein BN1058_02834 [Paraliobacillus sp. PM-2]|uniref:hypothetical protein n=1 Tax=Paraliobacillus sp. PM-2 TaxID=1462524 RepID=UPI00061C8C64|nr:hypothetical protein [Paraliobacillus sp. PM-2]CQR48464.1 hypothetical protein BN1058_02834 [Paraliobacillus sp. PM-2]